MGRPFRWERGLGGGGLLRDRLRRRPLGCDRPNGQIRGRLIGRRVHARRGRRIVLDRGRGRSLHLDGLRQRGGRHGRRDCRRRLRDRWSGGGRRYGNRCRCGSRRRSGRPRGEQAERVDVAVGIGGDPDAEVDVRRRRDHVGALADVADDRAFRDEAAAQDARRAELQQRHRKAVGGLDRDRPTAARDRADERDRPRGRSKHRAPELGADVDAAMLPARVAVRAERERSQHRPRCRPDPGVCCRGGGERREYDQDREDSPHNGPPLLRGRELPTTLAA